MRFGDEINFFYPEFDMNQVKSKNPILSGSDILFECGQCGKSLAIDCRGAGLNIHCPQCDSELEVPIPDGFDLAALDKEISDSVESDEGSVAVMPVSAKNGVASDERPQINALKTELEVLRTHRRYLEQQHISMLKTIKAVTLQLDEFHKAIDELSLMLDDLNGPQSDETQKIPESAREKR